MKKLISIIIAATLLSSFAFAKKYKGDIQLNMGISTEEMKVKDDVDMTAKSGMFEFDIQTWHLFGINDWFSVGFMAGLNTGTGLTTELKEDTLGKVDNDDLTVAAHVNFLLGPAVGFDVGKVVRFNVTTGLDLGIINMYSRQQVGDSSEVLAPYCSSAGIVFQTQAKFLPKSRVSPIVSYRVTNDFSKKLFVYDSKEDDHKDYSVDSINVINNAFTVGISFNW